MHSDIEFEARHFFRLGITGLPGSGKTSLAYRLAPFMGKDTKKGIALFLGDDILPENILPICRIVDRFVVEHICLAQICSKGETGILDAIIFLDIFPEECKFRCSQRENHRVGINSFEELYKEIRLNIENLIVKHKVLICTVNKLQQQHILEYNLHKKELMNFLFPNTFLLRNYM